MLKDIFFYPLAVFMIFCMIAVALSFGDGDVLTGEQIRAQGFTAQGQNLTKLTAAPGIDFDFIPASSGEPAYVQLYTNLARDVAPPSQGVFAPLGAVYDEAFAGHKLRLTITARASAQNGLSEFDMAYFSGSSGWTGWTRKTLGPDWADYVIDFEMKPLSEEPDLNYFSMWPGFTAEPLRMDVKYMNAQIISAL